MNDIDMGKDCAIEAVGLGRDYQVRSRRTEGTFWWRRLLARPEVVRGLREITLRVEHGEFLGLIGPNGAGKTTTVKLLSGLLHPTSGSLRVQGHRPAARSPGFLKDIAVVMGQHSQLWWELPSSCMFDLHRVLYEIPTPVFKERLSEFIDLLHLGDLVDVPVRELSLGQRARCQLAVGLLHGPKLLLLDEPTLGLDVLAQRQIREFLRRYNKDTGATVVLTSHNMADIKYLCARLVVLHQGALIYDGSISEFEELRGNTAQIRVGVKEASLEGEVLEVLRRVTPSAACRQEDGQLILKARRDEVGKIVGLLAPLGEGIEVSIEELSLEDIVLEAFEELGAPKQ